VDFSAIFGVCGVKWYICLFVCLGWERDKHPVRGRDFLRAIKMLSRSIKQRVHNCHINTKDWVAMKKCTPYSFLERILFPDKHKMTRSRLSSRKPPYGVHFFIASPVLSIGRQLCTPLFYALWQHFGGPRKSRPLTGCLSSCPLCLVARLSHSQPQTNKQTNKPIDIILLGCWKLNWIESNW
jgi:hypothetical protein